MYGNSSNIEEGNDQTLRKPGQTEQMEEGIVPSDDNRRIDRSPSLTEEISTHVTIKRRFSVEHSRPMEKEDLLPLVADGLQQLVNQTTDDPTPFNRDEAEISIQTANVKPTFSNPEEIISYERQGSKFLPCERRSSMFGNTTAAMLGNTPHAKQEYGADEMEDFLAKREVSFRVQSEPAKLQRRASLLSSSSQRYYALQDKDQSIIKRITKLSPLNKFYLWALVIPMVISLWYAAAIVFPPAARSKAPYLLWTDGALTYNQQGHPKICPRASICAEGILQIMLIVLARLSAFALYVVMGLTFISKMHSTIHYLSKTYLSTKIPFQSFHEVHKRTSKIFGFLALLHTFTHYLRYILRGDSGQILTRVHISGLVAMLVMMIVILIMTPAFRERFAFEKRLNAHWLFFFVVVLMV